MAASTGTSGISTSASSRRELSESARSTTGARRSEYQAYSGAPASLPSSGTSIDGSACGTFSPRWNETRSASDFSCSAGRTSQPATSGSSTSPANARPDLVSAFSCPFASVMILGASPASHASNGANSARPACHGNPHRLVGRGDAGPDHLAVEHVEAETQTGRLRRDGSLEPARELIADECARRRSGRRRHGLGCDGLDRCGGAGRAVAARPRPPRAWSGAPSACGTRGARRSGARTRGRSAWLRVRRARHRARRRARGGSDRRLRSAFSRPSRRFCPTTPLISSAWARMPSRSP